MLHVIVLGAAAGGGLPQWNCFCINCARTRSDRQGQNTQASLAVSGNGQDWILVNASPDLRQQINATSPLHPAASTLRNSPIVGVVLTNGEVDAVAGLLSMREGSPFAIFAHSRVLDVLQSNSIFNVLDRERVPRVSVASGVSFEPRGCDGSAGLRITAFDVPGKPPWYLERVSPACEGDTLGLRIEAVSTGKSVCVVPACARVTDDIKTHIDGCDILFFDGTLWRDDELIARGLGLKTGQGMGHIAMDGAGGAIASLADVNAGRKVFVHINNSNPVWHASPERDAAERAGWEIGCDGMEFRL